MIKQTVLPSNLEITKDEITSHAGLAVLGEFVTGRSGPAFSFLEFASYRGRSAMFRNLPGVYCLA